MSQHMRGGWRTTHRNQFCPSNVWVPRMEFGPQGWWEAPFLIPLSHLFHSAPRDRINEKNVTSHWLEIESHHRNWKRKLNFHAELFSHIK